MGLVKYQSAAGLEVVERPLCLNSLNFDTTLGFAKAPPASLLQKASISLEL